MFDRRVIMKDNKNVMNVLLRGDCFEGMIRCNSVCFYVRTGMMFKKIHKHFNNRVKAWLAKSDQNM